MTWHERTLVIKPQTMPFNFLKNWEKSEKTLSRTYSTSAAVPVSTSRTAEYFNECVSVPFANCGEESEISSLILPRVRLLEFRRTTQLFCNVTCFLHLCSQTVSNSQHPTLTPNFCCLTGLLVAKMTGNSSLVLSWRYIIYILYIYIRMYVCFFQPNAPCLGQSACLYTTSFIKFWGCLQNSSCECFKVSWKDGIKRPTDFGTALKPMCNSSSICTFSLSILMFLHTPWP